MVKKEDSEEGWHCIQTKPKSEHIAGASLRQFEDVEVYCPRIRYHKSTRRGKVWFTEALFPGYLFARFDAELRLRAVSSANAVSKLLRFGDHLATIPPNLIEQIRAEMEGQEMFTVENHDTLSIGEEKEVASGPLKGFQGIVTNLLSGGERVRLLVEMFGDLNEVEVRSGTLLSVSNPRDYFSGSKHS
ncbi:MAG: transcriptional antiterminator RfaH [Verrucomicrobiales bacterium]|jgi:transcriptional antiterminator RfaH